jgi:hypothetical protein
LALVAGSLGCESAAEQAARETAVAKTEIARSDSTARAAATRPLTGKWNEESLTDRLLRAGVAPRRVMDAEPGPAFMPGERLLFRAGGGEVHAWIFADSSARLAVSRTLDPITATPQGAAVPYALPLTLVLQNNLIAVVTGSAVNQERIANALLAGLPVSAEPPPGH